jgi:hypothetical protein
MPTALLAAPEGCWTPTTAVAYQLGVSPDTLRRYARSGYLKPGTHYRPGVLPNSPWVWRVDAVAQQLLQLSTKREQEQHSDQELASPSGEE